MGEPGWGNAQSPIDESIVYEEGTRGSETSKYPEEKKENSISLVAVSYTHLTLPTKSLV